MTVALFFYADSPAEVASSFQKESSRPSESAAENNKKTNKCRKIQRRCVKSRSIDATPTIHQTNLPRKYFFKKNEHLGEKAPFNPTPFTSAPRRKRGRRRRRKCPSGVVMCSSGRPSYRSNLIRFKRHFGTRRRVFFGRGRRQEKKRKKKNQTPPPPHQKKNNGVTTEKETTE